MTTKPPPTAPKPGETATEFNRQTAWHSRDWETLFVVGVVGLILLGTLWMVLISVTDSDPDNKFRIVPAAAVMVMVEVWLIFYLPRYDKLAFWGTVIALATYLFFAVPFLFLGLLPVTIAVVGSVLVAVSLLCGYLLYRRRARFFPLASSAKASPKKR